GLCCSGPSPTCNTLPTRQTRKEREAFRVHSVRCSKKKATTPAKKWARHRMRSKACKTAKEPTAAKVATAGDCRSHSLPFPSAEGRPKASAISLPRHSVLLTSENNCQRLANCACLGVGDSRGGKSSARLLVPNKDRWRIPVGCDR